MIVNKNCWIFLNGTTIDFYTNQQKILFAWKVCDKNRVIFKELIELLYQLYLKYFKNNVFQKKIKIYNQYSVLSSYFDIN